MTVIEEIVAERQRQIEAEGWSLKHDDDHDDRSLAAAAATYAWLASLHSDFRKAQIKCQSYDRAVKHEFEIYYGYNPRCCFKGLVNKPGSFYWRR